MADETIHCNHRSPRRRVYGRMESGKGSRVSLYISFVCYLVFCSLVLVIHGHHEWLVSNHCSGTIHHQHKLKAKRDEYALQLVHSYHRCRYVRARIRELPYVSTSSGDHNRAHCHSGSHGDPSPLILSRLCYPRNDFY
uniref:Uncharacterized protein n=1 Tax=Parascaris equorum TaxID=6256 RepID=A0A914RA92_PAREQ